MKKFICFILNFFYLMSVLSSCSADLPKIVEQQSLIVQVPLENKVISTLQENLKPQIENIVREELVGHTLDKNYPLFFFKRRQAITIYYLNDFNVNGRDMLFSGIDTLMKHAAPKDVTLTSDLAFFGEDAGGPHALVDLVMMIDDSKKELFVFNQEMKILAHKLNEDYKKIHERNMYDIAKSERFPYKPHLSLGHLRANYIKTLISDQTVAQQTIERIKKRIMQSVEQELKTLFATERRSVDIKSANIYDLKTRDYVKNIRLSHNCNSV